MIDWGADIDLDCPGCECCTEDDCSNEGARCIYSGCRCYTDQPPETDDV